MINRSDKDIEGTLLKVNPIQDQRYFDLIAGEELAVSSEKEIALTGKIAARGLGCFLAASTVNLGVDFLEFLDSQAAIYKRMDDHTLHPHREVQLKPSASTPKIKSPPRGMVAVHPDPAHMLTIHMRSRECGFYDSMTENEEGFWNESYLFHSREFVRKGPSSPYAMDKTPVTNDQYAEFLKATRYQPKHKENFLRHWISGMPPAGKSDHPVVWVALEDARAYALWAGKRLPTEEEWQYAAQGEMELEYPWGDGLRAGVCNQGETSDTIPVKTFPEGRSPLGCYDLCGNVWQWTESERTDGRTRFCIIRGGSYFSPKGSFWYVDGGPRPAHYATKFLLMWPGLDRCATIGFRCAIDLSF
jgi:formylglycine-generating enzyme required for sulfatase activity